MVIPASTKNISNLLSKFRNSQKLFWCLALVQFGVFLTLIALFFSVFAESILWFSPTIRYPLLIILKTLSSIFIVLPILFYLVFWFLKKIPNDESLARRIWKKDDDVRDQILLSLQLSTTEPDQNSSNDLRNAAIQIGDDLAEGVGYEKYVDKSYYKKTIRLLSITILVLIIAVSFNYGSLNEAKNRILNPHQSYLKPGRVIMSMAMGSDTVSVVQNDSLEILVRVKNGIPDQLNFVIDDGTGLIHNIDASLADTNSILYSSTIKSVSRSCRIFARSGKLHSDTTYVRVISRPRIARLEVSVQPPSYTGNETSKLPIGVGDLSGLYGSRINFTIEASRKLKSSTFYIHRNSGHLDSINLPVDNRLINGSFNLRESGKWWVKLTALDGIESEDPIRWNVAAIEDGAPYIEILMPEDGSFIPNDMIVPFVSLAIDDYGITEMALRFRLYSPMFSPDSVGEEEYYKIPLSFVEIDPGRVVVRSGWSLEDQLLLPTDEVHFFVEAWDNNEWSGRNHVRSEMRKLIFPSVVDLIEQNEAHEENIVEDLEAAMRQVEQSQEQLVETLEQLKSNPDEMSWEETRELQQMLQNQDSVLEQLEKVAETIQQMQEQSESQSLMSEELMEKYSQLQELLEEVATPEMRAAMEQLREAMEEMDGEKIREALENMSFDQEKMLENIERNLSILEQLQAERKLEELTKMAEDLLNREEALAEQMDDASAEEMDRQAAEQSSIEKDLENLESQIKETASELAEMNEAVSDSLDQIAEDSENSDLSQEMKSAESAMQSGQRQKAKKSAEKSSKQLKKMSERLKNAQQNFNQQSKDQLSADMDRLFQGILLVSRKQEDLRKTSEELSLSSPRYRELASDQQSLVSALSRVDKEVGKIMAKSFFAGANIARGVEEARNHMVSAVAQYTDRVPKEVTFAQGQAMGSLHKSLRSLNKSQQQMQGAGSQTGYQEMMERLKQMSEQQQGINEGTDGMPMPRPGGQTPGSLAQMAAQQRALGEQMRQTEKDARSMEDILGDLDGLGDAMESVAKDLDNKNVTTRTKNLQKRILQRLLDSQRSLQQREESRERIGRSAENMRRLSPGELGRSQEDLLRERLLRALEGDYNTTWRETIKEYFRALEREAGKKKNIVN
jgi:Domain of unknown function (DUF4175)